jgi:hypothetical protein
MPRSTHPDRKRSRNRQQYRPLVEKRAKRKKARRDVEAEGGWLADEQTKPEDSER